MYPRSDHIQLQATALHTSSQSLLLLSTQYWTTRFNAHTDGFYSADCLCCDFVKYMGSPTFSRHEFHAEYYNTAQ